MAKISWAHLTKLYEKQRSSLGLSLVPKLKFEHVALTSFSKMRVDLVAQVSIDTSMTTKLIYTSLVNQYPMPYLLLVDLKLKKQLNL